MKAIETFYKSTFLTKVVFLFFFVTVNMGCSKDDEPAPQEIIKSIEKELLSFSFLATNNTALTEDVIAIIDAATKTITATLPIDTPLTELTPSITTSPKTTVSPEGLQDFTNPLTFTVVAEDKSTTNYSVTITRELSEKGILQLILVANPDNTLGWDLENNTDLGNLNGVTLNTQGSIFELDLPNKNLNKLPEEIGLLSNLEILKLGENNLSSLPKEIGLLTNLKTLILAVNQLTSLPDEIGQLGNLNELFLNSNQLTSITSEIGALTKLTYLSLGSNQLSTIPKEIGALSNLIDLFLNNNELEAIPSEIGQLTDLKQLSLQSNKLSSLPKEIGKLTSLETLNLNNNQLTVVPSEVGFLIHLTTLQLSENNITVLPSLVYYIKLYQNPIMNITHDLVQFGIDTPIDALIGIYSANPDNTLNWSVDNFPGVEFDGNGNPKVITINNKNMTRIPENINHINSLETLNANSNNLESLPSSLGSIETLNVLTFASNQLNTVPPELGQLTNLALLSLTENPLTTLPTEVCDMQTSNGGILTILTDPNEGCN